MILQTMGAGFLLLAVIGLVIVRPRQLNVAWFASGGAVLTLMLGLVPLSALKTIFLTTWDASVTLIALFLLSEALDRNGFFTWAALHLARIACGSGWRLFLLVLALTTGTTALLANDGAVLILTPIFARLLVKIYPRGRFWLPFVLVAGFFADATSTLLVPSNLTNIIVADATSLTFTEFARWMALPTVCAALTGSLCFGVRFRKELSTPYDTRVLTEPAAALQDHFVFRISWGALLLLVVGYIVGGQLHWPISCIAAPIALLLVLLVQIRNVTSARTIVLSAPWSILLYALGMFVIITAASSSHALLFLTTPLHTFVSPSAGVAGMISAGGMLALLSAGANNLPATLIGVLVLKNASSPSVLAISAIVLGVNIGPKLTPYGSLATLLWLGILARNDIHLSWRQYVIENWWVTLLTLAASFAGLLLASLLLRH